MISRRDFLKLGGAALLTSAFSRLNLPLKQGLALPPFIEHGSRNYHYIAITFDDCWHPDVLEQLSEIVAPYPDYHLTYFAVGDALQINEAVSPGIWRRLNQKGHEIGYHTMHHYDPQTMSAKALISDYDQWTDVLHQVLGFLPEIRFAKPPYNDLSSSFQQMCIERGLVATGYSIGFEGSSVQEGLNAAAKVQDGDIVQMHTYQDPKQGRLDVSITEAVVPYLAEQNMGLVTMSKLYDDLLRERNSSDGCDLGQGESLTRTCLD